MICPNCQLAYFDGVHCSNCGYKLKKTSKHASKQSLSSIIPAFIIFMAFIVCLINASATQIYQDLGTYQYNTSINLTFTCRINNQLCSNSATGKLWMQDQNSLPYLNNVSLFNTDQYYYNLGSGLTPGQYYGNVIFTDMGIIGTQYFTFNVGSTQNRIDFKTCPNSNTQLIMYGLMLIMSLFLIWLSYRYQIFYTQFLAAMILFVLSFPLLSCNGYIGVIMFTVSLIIGALSFKHKIF